METYNLFNLLEEGDVTVTVTTPSRDTPMSTNEVWKVQQMLNHLQRNVCPNATWEMAVDAVKNRVEEDKAVKKAARKTAKAAKKVAKATAKAETEAAADYAQRLNGTEWATPRVYTTPKKPTALKNPSDEGWTVVK